MDYIEVENGLNLIGGKYGCIDNRFNSPFKDKNFMTNNIVMQARFKNGIWFELSYGKGIIEGFIMGVTFIKNGKDLHNLSTCCHDFKEVKSIMAKVSRI